MKSAEGVKERLAKDQELTTESFEAIAAARKSDAEHYRSRAAEDLEGKAKALVAVLELERRVNSLKAKLVSVEKNSMENAKLRNLFRDHLDDSADDMENDNEWEREARRIMWNARDSNATRRRSIMAEDIEE